jgi:hypothetical protein
MAVGPRTSVIGLTAAALEPTAVDRVMLYGALGSLKELIEQNQTVVAMPEMFCFGLLETVDVKQLTALVAPRLMRFVSPTDRAKTELAGMPVWYRLLGGDFDPLR